jgi:hypothetical protein
MTEDQQQQPVKRAPESRTSRRSKWAPGAWAAAAEYNRNKPEVRSPVIVGGRSMIQTPEQLQDLCQLPTVPSLTLTTETTLSLFPGKEEQEQEAHEGKETLYIADVSLRLWLDLQKCTEGDMVLVLFRGEKRYAWLAKARKTESCAAE